MMEKYKYVFQTLFDVIINFYMFPYKIFKKYFIFKLID